MVTSTNNENQMNQIMYGFWPGKWYTRGDGVVFKVVSFLGFLNKHYPNWEQIDDDWIDVLIGRINKRPGE